MIREWRHTVEVCTRNGGVHSAHGPGCSKVDPPNLRVGNRAADEDRLEHPGEIDVGDVAGLTGEEAEILTALHPGTRVKGPHALAETVQDIQSSFIALLASSAGLA